MEVPQTLLSENICIDNYTLYEKIGEGGYGLVFKAKQLSTNQFVAIKTIKLTDTINEQTKTRQLARFERETRLCAEINHPNIVKILDKGYLKNGAPFIVFEYVEGETLKDYILKKKGLDTIEMAHLMEQILDALAYAHDKGIVHRDLKPSNIMVSELSSKNHIKILDFGIGAFTRDFRSADYKNITVTQDILGTPMYSAPEQLRGEPPTVKSDIYAWGLIALECLTGKPVMNGGSIAEIFQQQLMPSSVPIPPSILGHEFANLLRRVLDKKPKKRIESVNTILKEFHLINFNTLTGKLVDDNNNIDSEETTVKNNSFYNYSFQSRKQLTIICLKLNMHITDNTSIDLEVLDAIQKDQLNLCKDTAIRYGGYVSESFLNNLAIYFGYPESNDTDARRAGRTALELINDIKKRSTLLLQQYGVSLSIQLGMHTGTSLIQRNQLPEGSTANKAFDLAHTAPPGNVFVSNTSQKILAPYLDFKEVKNNVSKRQVYTVYQLIGERSIEALSSLKPWSGSRKLVGREHEKKKILNLWNNSTVEGCSVILNGQAGIGKSKLTYEIKKEVQLQGIKVKECRCLPEQQNNALYPFLELLRNILGINSLKNNNDIISRIEEALKVANCQEKDSLPLLCSWLSIPLPSDRTIHLISPLEQKKILFATLKRCLFEIEKQEQFLFVLEDLHWLDLTSLEFVEYLLSDIQNNSYMLLMTSRPSFNNNWNNKHLVQIDIPALPQQAVELILQEMLNNKAVSDNTLKYIVKKADGIPLYTEELINMLIEQGYLELKNDIYNIKPDIDELIPTTLQDLLNARLDGLGIVKETAQQAAAIGREFSYELLIKSSIKDEGAIQNDLNLLVDANLIYEQRRVEGATYIFRHALIRDAAYESMVASHQKEVHLRIANSLETYFPQAVEESPINIAQHLAQARLFKKASYYGIKDIKKQSKSSASHEAIAIHRLTEIWINNITQQYEKEELKLNLHLAILPAIMKTGGYGSEELFQLSIGIKKSVNLLNNISPKVDFEYRNDCINKANLIEFLCLHNTSKRAEAKKLGSKILEKAVITQNNQQEMVILIHLAQAYQIDGDWSTAKDYFERALFLFDENRDINLVDEYGIHVKAQGLVLSSFSYLYLGSPNKALLKIKEAAAYSEEIGDDTSIAFAYVFIGLYGYFTGNFDLIKESVDTYKQKHNKTREEVWHTIFLDILYACFYRKSTLAQSYIQELLDTGQDVVIAWYTPYLTKLYLEENKPELAIQLITKTKKIVFEKKMCGAYSFILHTLAQCYFAKDKYLSKRIKNTLDKAIFYARTQNEVFFETEILLYYCKLNNNKSNSEKIDRLKELIELFECPENMEPTDLYKSVIQFIN
ncbi:TOMM system kinase/cyclase fusion protein [Tenacibaculum sp. MAR_2009_124]|uniref:TOMM system kinase/cyclase fusion protein n=1 Tax=Tenacibaculum sp. MAR_2009_124 TaxID=1250059 RepID=UPI00089A5E1E|nr:TOMM system kinase/cyclase fusion protein [Tenacibaculum sp. MAR_2009_124]SEB47467.1 TOMM system kinase/cyclase fusion protein [Tenacibaculum sp. MAR_2009_124]